MPWNLLRFNESKAILKGEWKKMRDAKCSEWVPKRKMLYVRKETACCKNSKCLFKQEKRRKSS